MTHIAYILLAICAPLAALAQRTEAGGASGFARGAHASRTLGAAWAAANHVPINSAYDDYDGDLLENWAEEALGTSPWTNDLTAANVNSAVALGALDLVPAKWKARYNFSLADVVGDADPDNDGWDNWSEWMAGSDPLSATNRPDTILRATIDLGRLPARGPLVVHAYSRFAMNGWPDAVYVRDLPPEASASVSVVDLRDADLVYGHIRQGQNWFFAWLNEDGSSLASVNGGVWPTWTDSEPASVADNQLDGVAIGVGVNEVIFHPVEKAESFARASWEGRLPEDHGGYEVLIKGNEYFKYKIEWPRTWIHEWDIVNFNVQRGGRPNFGLGVYGSSSEMFADDGSPKTFNVMARPEAVRRMAPTGTTGMQTIGHVTNWTHSATGLPKPVAYAPAHMDFVRDMRPEFRFSLDPEYTEFDFSLNNFNGEIWSQRILAPGRRWNPATGRRDLVVWRFPVSLNDVANIGFARSTGWHVTGYSPVLKTFNANQRSVMVNFYPLDYPAAAAASVADATGGSAQAVRVSAWRDAACVNGLLWRGSSGLSGGSVRVPLPAGGPYYIKAEAISNNTIAAGLGLGYAGGRRPVPIFAEHGVNSVTNTIIMRRFK